MFTTEYFSLPLGTHTYHGMFYTVFEDSVYRVDNFGTKKIYGDNVKPDVLVVANIELAGLERHLIATTK